MLYYGRVSGSNRPVVPVEERFSIIKGRLEMEKKTVLKGTGIIRQAVHGSDDYRYILLFKEHGADVDERVVDGFTALHNVILLNRGRDLVQALLHAGANPCIKTTMVVILFKCLISGISKTKLATMSKKVCCFRMLQLGRT